jgi:hypothetical protein
MAQKENKKVGRPTDLLPETVTKLEEVLKIGMPIVKAIEYAGISRNTYYRWLNENKEFNDKMTSAQNYARIIAGNLVVKDIEGGDVNSAKWWLEKKHSDEFGGSKQNQLNIAGNEVSVSFNFTKDQIERLLDEPVGE